jgi:hypothetical protein
MPVWVSLVVIAAVAGGAIAASLWRDWRRQRSRPEPEPAPAPAPAAPELEDRAVRR